MRIYISSGSISVLCVKSPQKKYYFMLLFEKILVKIFTLAYLPNFSTPGRRLRYLKKKWFIFRWYFIRRIFVYSDGLIRKTFNELSRKEKFNWPSDETMIAKVKLAVNNVWKWIFSIPRKSTTCNFNTNKLGNEENPVGNCYWNICNIIYKLQIVWSSQFSVAFLDFSRCFEKKRELEILNTL